MCVGVCVGVCDMCGVCAFVRDSKCLRVYIQNVSMCAGKTPHMHTRRRFESTHVVVQRATPQTPTNTNTHSNRS